MRATSPVRGTLHAKQVARRVSLAQENGLELVHAGVGEQQGRVIVRHDGRGDDVDVLALLEEVNEGLAHTAGRPLLAHAHTPAHAAPTRHAKRR